MFSLGFLIGMRFDHRGFGGIIIFRPGKSWRNVHIEHYIRPNAMKWIALVLSLPLAFGCPSLARAGDSELSNNGIKGVLLGTGYPRPDPDRAGPSTAIIVNGKYFVVDAGRAVVLRLSTLEQQMPPIAAVLLTHLHSDHISGLPDLFNTSGLNVGTLEGEELALRDAEPFALAHFPIFARIARNGFFAASATTSRSAV